MTSNELAVLIAKARRGKDTPTDCEISEAKNLSEEHSRRSPLQDFIDQGRRALLCPTFAPLDPRQYANVIERRRHASDLIDRIELVSAGYFALVDANVAWKANFDLINRVQPLVQRDANTFDVPAALHARGQQIEAHASLVTGFLYYEIHSIFSILKSTDYGGRKPAAGSELEFVIRIRDKVFAHPKLEGMMRRERTGLKTSASGPIEVQQVGDQEPDPILRLHYRREVDRHRIEKGSLPLVQASDMETFLSQIERTVEAEQQEENERWIRSKTLRRNLSHQQETQMKAYRVREPSLTAAIIELGPFLIDHVLPTIQGIGRLPIPSDRFYDPIP